MSDFGKVNLDFCISRKAREEAKHAKKNCKVAFCLIEC